LSPHQQHIRFHQRIAGSRDESVCSWKQELEKAGKGELGGYDCRKGDRKLSTNDIMPHVKNVWLCMKNWKPSKTFELACHAQYDSIAQTISATDSEAAISFAVQVQLKIVDYCTLSAPKLPPLRGFRITPEGHLGGSRADLSMACDPLYDEDRMFRNKMRVRVRRRILARGGDRPLCDGDMHETHGGLLGLTIVQ
jgi:hypothetical protein